MKIKQKKDIDNWEKICNNSCYKSAQTISSNNQLYTSKTAWRHDIPGAHNQIIDCDEFWEDAINLKIYNNNYVELPIADYPPKSESSTEQSVTYESEAN